MSTLKEKAESILNEKNEKIMSENIKKDIQIFDVTGSLEEGIDTSDATATENDLVQGTTAYVNGDKLYGTLEDRRSDNLDIDATYVMANDEFETLYVRGSSLYNNVVVDSSTETNTVTPYNLITPEIGLAPEKIKKDEVILGVTGTYEGTSSKSKIKLFNNTSEMNSSTGNEDGDIALVYDLSPKVPVNGVVSCNMLILPLYIPVSEVPIGIIYSTSGLEKDWEISSDGNGIQYKVYNFDGWGTDFDDNLYVLDSNDNTRYIRQYYYNTFNPYIVYTGNEGYPGIITTKDEDASVIVGDISEKFRTEYIKPVHIGGYRLHYYSRNSWYNSLPCHYNAWSNDVVKGKIAKNVDSSDSVGTLDTTKSARLVTLPSSLIDPNDGSVTGNGPGIVIWLDNEATLGDKRYISFKKFEDDGMNQNYYYYTFIYNNPDKVVYCDGQSIYDDNNWNYTTPDYILKRKFVTSSYEGEYFSELSFTDLNETNFGTFVSSYNTPNKVIANYSQPDQYGWMVTEISTNMKVLNSNEEVILEAGPKASDISVGKYYVNAFGEKVAGTKS